MLNFDTIENLVTYMFDKVDGDEPVSAVVSKDLSVSILTELLEYNDVTLKYANVDDYEYDREYIVTLSVDSDSWDITIEPIYNYEKEMYFATDGYVLFHEDVNSKALIDMQNNENVEMSGYDWFVVGEEVGEDTNEDNDVSEDDNDSGFVVTVKTNLDTSEVGNIIDDMKKSVRREMNGMFDMLYRPYHYTYPPHPLRLFW